MENLYIDLKILDLKLATPKPSLKWLSSMLSGNQATSTLIKIKWDGSDFKHWTWKNQALETQDGA